MSVWEQIQCLPEETLRSVQSIYGDHFPIVVRGELAVWIEEKPWSELDSDNAQHDSYASSLVTSLIQELQAKAASQENIILKLQLNDAAKNLAQRYTHNAYNLVNTVKQCLQTEQRIIQHSLFNAGAGYNSEMMDVKPSVENEIITHLDKIRRATEESEQQRRRMQQEQEKFFIQYQECLKLENYLKQSENVKAQLTQPTTESSSPNSNQPVSTELLNKVKLEKETLDGAIKSRAATLVQLRIVWIDRLHEILASLNALQQRVLDDELIKWKRAQQLAGNGAPFDNNLDTIQKWCEQLADLTWSNRQQLENMETLCSQLPLDVQAQHSQADRISTLKKYVTNLLSSLVTSTFVIEKQPPQVMKTNTRITTTVRLLVGGKLNVHMTPPKVKVSIVSEPQANALLKNDKAFDSSPGELVNNETTMDYHSGTSQLSVSFRNLQLKKIVRGADRKGTESVKDEKFSLLFKSQFKIANGELVFQVWTLSLPVAVIVHGNQEPEAWATVTWDNAFAEAGRVPFYVQDKVPWPKVSEVLNMKFYSAADRHLTPANLLFLAGKVFRNPSLMDGDQLLVTWSSFSKEPLPERNFTFWSWFYSILKVTKEYLRMHWKDGSVIGFIGRKQTEELLLTRPYGTFLLRYSDSEQGGVTIAWVAEGQDGRPEVFMLQPFTAKDFAIRPLADRLNDLKHLLYLYPDTPKDTAFAKYYTPINENQNKPINGYVTPVLVTQIPGWANNSLDSYPNTPQSVMNNPNSPGDSSMFRDSLAMNTGLGGMQSSSSLDQVMNGPGSELLPEMDYSDLIMNMDLPSDSMSTPDVDFSNINVSDLMGVLSSPSRTAAKD